MSPTHEKDVYIQKLMNTTLLADGEEIKLATEWRLYKDEVALHKLINAYTRLVVSMACKFKNYGLPLADLIQEGNIGLIIAAEKYDPIEHPNIHFAAYAKWWIKSLQQTYIIKNWSIVRLNLGTASRQLFFNLSRIKFHLLQIGIDNMSLEDKSYIAKKLNTSIQTVDYMETRLNSHDLSLDYATNAREDTNQETLAEHMPDDGPSPEDVSTSTELKQNNFILIQNALSCLTEREQYIVMNSYLNKNQKSITILSQEVGLSKEGTRKVLLKSLKKMHLYLVQHKHISRDDIF